MYASRGIELGLRLRPQFKVTMYIDPDSSFTKDQSLSDQEKKAGSEQMKMIKKENVDEGRMSSTEIVFSD